MNFFMLERAGRGEDLCSKSSHIIRIAKNPADDRIVAFVWGPGFRHRGGLAEENVCACSSGCVTARRHQS
jgi:hypothetical protein